MSRMQVQVPVEMVQGNDLTEECWYMCVAKEEKVLIRAKVCHKKSNVNDFCSVRGHQFLYLVLWVITKGLEIESEQGK